MATVKNVTTFLMSCRQFQRSANVHNKESAKTYYPKAIRRDMVEAVAQYKRLDGVTDALAKIAASVLRQPAPLQISSALKTLTNRVLVIRGMHDNIVSAAEVPVGVRLQALTHSGHMPHMEEPDRVNELLLRHFAEWDRAAEGGR